jgi:hypothetical protein
MIMMIVSRYHLSRKNGIQRIIPQVPGSIQKTYRRRKMMQVSFRRGDDAGLGGNLKEESGRKRIDETSRGLRGGK